MQWLPLTLFGKLVMFGVKFPKTDITIFTLSRLVEQSSKHVHDKMKNYIFTHNP